MKKNNKQIGTLFLLVGPSRVGKDTILRTLLRRRSLGLRKLVTTTTRPRRARETDGKTYNYITDKDFLQKIKRNEFLEWAPVRNYRFGTPYEPLMSWLRAGHCVVQQIDVRGAATLKKNNKLSVVTIFILPGSTAELKRRLSAKSFTPAQRKIRWKEMVAELKRQTEFDYRVVNAEGKLKMAIDEVDQIIRAVVLKTSKNR